MVRLLSIISLVVLSGCPGTAPLSKPPTAGPGEAASKSPPQPASTPIKNVATGKEDSERPIGPPVKSTYRLAGNLVAGRPEPCEECGIALVYEGSRLDDGSNTRAHFAQHIGWGLKFQFRWGVEQTVQIETTRIEVPPNVVDDPGIRVRIVRVIEQRPLPGGSPFKVHLPTAPPGNYEFTVKPTRDGLLLDKVPIKCARTSVCTALAEFKLGTRGVTLEMTHASAAGGPTLHALRFDP